MQRFWPALALFLLIAVAVRGAVRTPAATPVSAPADVFAADRAMRHVREIALRPHPSGGEDHPRVRAYLASEIAALGITPEVQEVTGVGTRYAVVGRVRNILARLPGTQPGGPSVLLMAHYDGVPASPGAADDGSGSAVLLETLRALRAGDPRTHDVIALFTDGEEAGLLGAAAFAREHPWAKDVAVTLNFEARGTRGPSLMFETGTGNLDVVRVLRSVGGGRATSLSTAVYRALPNDTDLSEIAVLDQPAMNFAFIRGADRYHTAEDDVVHLDPGSVQHHGNQALGLARAFANGPLPRPRTSDAVFFDLPLLGLIVYPELWAVPLALIAFALAIAAIILIRKTETRLYIGVALGALGLLVAAALAGAVGIAEATGLHRLHGAIGSGSPEWSGIYASGVALLALALALACYALIRRWASAPSAYLGGLLAWSALSLVVSWLAPGVSFLLTWPLIAAGGAAIAFATRPNASLTAVLAWVGAIVAIFFLAPTIYLMVCVALGLYGVGAAVLGAFTALGVWLLAPHFERLAGTRKWRVPALAAVAALVVFTVGAVAVRTDPDHPTGASLVYAVDADSGRAWLAGFAWSESARVWLRRSLRGSGAQRADTLPSWMRRSFNPRNVVSAPLAIPTLAPATATVLSDSTVGGERRVTLRITPSRGTRSIAMGLESGTITSADVDGRRVRTDRYRRAPQQWTLEYSAPADDGFTLAITSAAATPLVLGLLSRHDGIPALPSTEIPQRPPGIIAVQSGDMSLVYRRVRL